MVGKVNVPKTFTQTHPLVAKLLDEDERRREAQKSTAYAYPWEKPLFDSPIERRRLRILNAIALALSRCDMKSSMSGREAKEFQVQVGQQQVSYVLERVPTRARPIRDNVKEKRTPERLRLCLLPWGRDSATSKSWEDRDGSLLEEQLADVVTGLIVAGEVKYRERAQHHYEWLLEQRRQEEEEARRAMEEAARRERERCIASVAARSFGLGSQTIDHFVETSDHVERVACGLGSRSRRMLPATAGFDSLESRGGIFARRRARFYRRSKRRLRTRAPSCIAQPCRPCCGHWSRW